MNDLFALRRPDPQEASAGFEAAASRDDGCICWPLREPSGNDPGDGSHYSRKDDDRGNEGKGADPGSASKKPAKVPEFQGGTLSESGFLKAADTFLGQGYKEVSPGRYKSADGKRQVRLGQHELRGPRRHAHFEALEDGHVVENTRVTIIKE